MGHNVSKSSTLSQRQFKKADYLRDAAGKIHQGQCRQRNALEQEYNAWLRSLSWNFEENPGHTTNNVWTRKKAPWHTSLRKKVTSLLNSKNHRNDAIVWPQAETRNFGKTKTTSSAKIRLSFMGKPSKFDHVYHTARHDKGRSWQKSPQIFSKPSTKKQSASERNGSSVVGDVKHCWEIPLDYNAIQGTSGLWGPRVLPCHVPGEEPFFPAKKSKVSRRVPDSDRKLSCLRSNENDLDNFYKLTSFQDAGSDEDYLSHTPDYSCARTISDNDQGHSGFSSKNQSTGPLLEPNQDFPDSVTRVLPKVAVEDEDIQNFSIDPFAPVQEYDHLLYDLPADYSKHTQNKDFQHHNPNEVSYMQIDFGPGSENFLFARNRNIDLYKAGQETAKDHTMTTSKVQRLNLGRERSFSSNGICSASSLLWMTDNAMISSLEKVKKRNYRDYSPPVTNRDAVKREREKRKLNSRKKKTRSLQHERTQKGYTTDTSTTDSNLVETRDEKLQRYSDKVFHRNEVPSSSNVPCERLQKFQNMDSYLEQKINDMVKTLIDDKLGSHQQLERRGREVLRQDSTNQIQDIIENHLASALTNIMVPRKNL
ncbi:unnamed protein product [Clavelina lepadiformis]|uniref:Uncharacterized protein n=1 Tax=Clavelina lepadiformis TaxID=159417 RepID=A0ABP0F6F7_CLALP